MSQIKSLPLAAIHVQPFSADSKGHGGNRRCLQIRDILDRHGVAALILDQKVLPRSFGKRLIKLALNPSLGYSLLRYGCRHPINEVSRLLTLKERVARLSANEHSSKTLIWESTKDLGFSLILDDQIKVIGLPHNIEALAEQDYSASLSGASTLFDCIGKEVSALRRCNKIFCISREDQWLLSNLGLKSMYLPYWPAQSILEECGSIRSIRKERAQARDLVLVLGTYLNAPTRYGINAIIKSIASVASNKKLSFVIAGYGTDQIRLVEELPENVSIAGPLTRSQLKALMCNAKAALVHQEYGTGVLTRITEFLLSGIPVVASDIASRSFQNIDGVWNYSNFQQAIHFLNFMPSDPFDPPRRPLSEERAFINALRLG